MAQLPDQEKLALLSDLVTATKLVLEGGRSDAELLRFTQALLKFNRSERGSYETSGHTLLRREIIEYGGMQPFFERLLHRLPTRVRKVLERMQIMNLEELVFTTEEKLMDRHNFGQISLTQLKSTLANHGLSLSMKRSEYFIALGNAPDIDKEET